MARQLAHLAILRGLRAPRVPHALQAGDLGVAADRLHAAQHRDVRAVVSLSAFAHPQEVMRRFMADKHIPYPVLGWSVLRHVQRVIGSSFDAIAPLHTITRVRCPVLLVHGRQDRPVPADDARRLQRAGSGAQLLPVAGSHDLRTALLPHAGTLVAFLHRALGAPHAAPHTAPSPVIPPPTAQTP